MGALAHYLEAEGLPTTQISLLREHTETIRPPRAMWVPFPFGRPLGVPNDEAFQRRVLLAALELCELPGGPVLRDFPEEAPAEGEVTAWSCPVSYTTDPREGTCGGSLTQAVRAEADQLRSWYDLGVRQRQRTTVGVSGMPAEEVVSWLSRWLEETPPASPRPELPLADALRLASQDLKAFYFEAAAAQPCAAPPGSQQFSHWFWRKTAAGRLLREIQAVCLSSSEESLRLVGQLLLVPVDQAQPGTDETTD